MNKMEGVTWKGQDEEKIENTFLHSRGRCYSSPALVFHGIPSVEKKRGAAVPMPQQAACLPVVSMASGIAQMALSSGPVGILLLK